DFDRQHVFQEAFHSAAFKERQSARHPDCRGPERRQVLWSPRPGARPGPFQARYQFLCAVHWRHPSRPMADLTRTLYAPPRLGEHIRSEPRIDPSARAISERALSLVAGLGRPADQARALFRHVDKEVGNEPTFKGPGLSDVECLQNGSGAAAAQSPLRAWLCPSPATPPRPVT